jgi:hypothetical protein
LQIFRGLCGASEIFIDLGRSVQYSGDTACVPLQFSFTLFTPTYSGQTLWTLGNLGNPGGFWWNVEELQIKEYESGNSRWIPGGFW